MTMPAITCVKIGIGVFAVALVVGAALPAQAASSPGWRRSASVRFGAASTNSEFLAVAPLSSKVAWAIGGINDVAQTGKPAAYHWTGKAWRPSALPTGLKGVLTAISAPSAKDVWALSNPGGYILHYNGSRWSTASKRFTPLVAQITGITAFSPSNVWVFGGSGAIPGVGTWRYNGKTWQQDKTATNLGIESASALSAANMWAIGSVMVGGDSIFHYTGAWHQAKASALSGLHFTDIQALSATNVWATANNGAAKWYLVHMTRRGWSRITVPGATDVFRLASDGHGGIWLTAQISPSTAWVLHRSAAGHWIRTLLTSSGSASGIARIPGTTSMWATGSVRRKVGSNAAIWADGRV
jgi:hypothetical protein